MNKKSIMLLVIFLLIYVAATYYSFNVDNAAAAVVLQCLTNIASMGIGAALMFIFIFISKLPH